MSEQNSDVLHLVGDIVSSYVSNNPINSADVPSLIANTYKALLGLSTPPTPEPTVYEPAVNPKKSVFPDRIVSLIDGKSYKSLKRHIGTHGLTPEEYRTRYGLPAEYPMVSPNYAAQRSELAKANGLGRKRSDTAE